jgi:hypothetical protein
MRDGWEDVALGTLVTKRDNFTPVIADKHYKVVGVQRSGWGLVDREPVRGDSMKFTKLMELEEDDLVYRVITAFEAPSTVVGSAFAGTFVTPQTFPVFQIQASRMLPAYMRLLTTSPVFHDAMAERCTGTVLRRKTISVGAFRSIPIVLPPLATQHRIVDLIGALDEAIEAADGVSDACSTLLSNVLDAHVSDDSLPLKDLASVKSGASWGAADGSSLPGEGFRPVLTIVNTRPGGAVELTERTYVRGLSARAATLTADSLVMIRTNGNRGRIGNIYRTPAEVVGDSVSAFQFVIEPRDVRLRDYLYWVMQAPTLQSAISSAASGSTGLGNIAAGWLNEMNIPWSEHVEREAFIGLCNAAGSAVESANEYAACVRSTRTNFLTALLSGEHEIPSSYDKHLGAIA